MTHLATSLPNVAWTFLNHVELPSFMIHKIWIFSNFQKTSNFYSFSSRLKAKVKMSKFNPRATWHRWQGTKNKATVKTFFRRYYFAVTSFLSVTKERSTVDALILCLKVNNWFQHFILGSCNEKVSGSGVRMAKKIEEPAEPPDSPPRSSPTQGSSSPSSNGTVPRRYSNSEQMEAARREARGRRRYSTLCSFTAFV